MFSILEKIDGGGGSEIGRPKIKLPEPSLSKDK